MIFRDEDWSEKPLRLERLLAMVSGYFHECASILDIGCGDGSRLTQIAGGQGKRFIGVDLYPSANGPDWISKADAAEMCWPDPPADGVLFFDSLEHLPQVEAAKCLVDAIEHARLVTVVFCPEGGIPSPDESVPGMRHLSAWGTSDLAELEPEYLYRLGGYHGPAGSALLAMFDSRGIKTRRAEEGGKR